MVRGYDPRMPQSDSESNSQYEEIYLQWRRATDDYNDLDRRYTVELERIRDLQIRQDEIWNRRERSAKEILESERDSEIESLMLRRDAEIEILEEELARRIEEINQNYDLQEEKIHSVYEPRLAPLRTIVIDEDGDEYEEDEEDFHSPEYDALEQEIQILKTGAQDLQRRRLEARHVLNKARELKLKMQRGR